MFCLSFLYMFNVYFILQLGRALKRVSLGVNQTSTLVLFCY